MATVWPACVRPLCGRRSGGPRGPWDHTSMPPLRNVPRYMLYLHHMPHRRDSVPPNRPLFAKGLRDEYGPKSTSMNDHQVTSKRLQQQNNSCMKAGHFYLMKNGLGSGIQRSRSSSGGVGASHRVAWLRPTQTCPCPPDSEAEKPTNPEPKARFRWKGSWCRRALYSERLWLASAGT